MSNPERTWFKLYPEGMPYSVLDRAPNTLRSLLEKGVEQYGPETAFICGNESVTYDEIYKNAKKLAAYMQTEMGLAKGARVAVATPNIIPFPTSAIANIMAGFIQVNVNPLYTPHELEHQLNDSGAEVIVVAGSSVATFTEVAKNTNVKTALVVAAEVPDIAGVKVIPYGEALIGCEADKFVRPEIGGEDLVFLQYTGGTTGLSKGAALSNSNVAINLTQLCVWLYGDNPPVKPVLQTALPLYHIFALVANFLTMFQYGGKNILIPDPSDMQNFIAIMKEHPPHFFTGVNTLFNGLLAQPNIGEVDFSNMDVSVGGGAPVQEVVSNKWRDVTGQHILEAYGLSETSPALTVNIPRQDVFLSSIGLPIPDTDISIRDNDNNEVPTGEAGELCAKGPQVMQGYWGQPEKTAEVMTPDGYFKTGDIAVMDEQGYFRIVDRKKDMVLVSGFNVYPNEIEDVVSRIDGVMECACIGVPDDKTGEAVKVFIVKTEGATLNEEGIRQQCRETLTGYKVPKHVVFLEALPKSTVGKILRRELRNY